MIEDEENSIQGGYWPSVSDLFMTLFIIAIAILAVVFFALLPRNNVASQKELIVAVGVDMGNIRRPVNAFRAPLDMEPLRPTQGADEVVHALGETSEKAVYEIVRLREELKVFADSDVLESLAKLRAENEALVRERERLKELMESVGGLSAAELRNRINDLERQLHDKPPIIRIDEQREEYRFTSGSSEIGKIFARGLMSNEFSRLAKEIVDREEAGRVKVDTLEIVGHTDGIPLSGRGNLDQKLPSLLAGNLESMEFLKAGSNNDLGLLRALSVKRQWMMYVRSHPEQSILEKVSVRCYSAGQTILPDPDEIPDSASFTRADPRARRIEMRLTRLRN